MTDYKQPNFVAGPVDGESFTLVPSFSLFCASCSCPFSLFCCACPWMMLYFHIAMLLCCSVMQIVITKMTTYLLSFATKLFYRFFFCPFMVGRSVTDSHHGICQVLSHKDSIPLVVSLSSRQSKLPLMYRASPPSLLPCTSILKSLYPSIAALQLCEPSHHTSVTTNMSWFSCCTAASSCSCVLHWCRKICTAHKVKAQTKARGQKECHHVGKYALTANTVAVNGFFGHNSW